MAATVLRSLRYTKRPDTITATCESNRNVAKTQRANPLLVCPLDSIEKRKPPIPQYLQTRTPVSLCREFSPRRRHGPDAIGTVGARQARAKNTQTPPYASNRPQDVTPAVAKGCTPLSDFVKKNTNYLPGRLTLRKPTAKVTAPKGDPTFLPAGNKHTTTPAKTNTNEYKKTT